MATPNTLGETHMEFTALRAQIEKTTKNLERGEVQLSDRIFLNHILDELQFILDNGGTNPSDDSESLWELLGSTNELVEDGLE